MCVLFLSKFVARNGQIASRTEQNGNVVSVSAFFPADKSRGLSEQTVEIGAEHLWQLVPFGDTLIPDNFRVTPIGSLDPELLFGEYEVVGRTEDPNFVQSPFCGRWEGDNVIFHLRHLELRTIHRVKGYRLESIPGVYYSNVRVRLNYSDFFEQA